ncbi:MAG: hypothetical protein JWP89_3186 [Schlesneria sp.]|nr:hypothetical protein [Schlesneria sp.]
MNGYLRSSDNAILSSLGLFYALLKECKKNPDNPDRDTIINNILGSTNKEVTSTGDEMLLFGAAGLARKLLIKSAVKALPAVAPKVTPRPCPVEIPLPKAA